MLTVEVRLGCSRYDYTENCRIFKINSINVTIIFQVSVFVRTCGNDNWEYTGLSCPEPICCHDKAPIPCANNTARTDQAKNE